VEKPSISEPQPLQRRVDKLQAILEVAKTMAAAHTLDELLPLILREAARVMGADRCSLFILDRQRNELWSRVAQGASQEIRVPVGQGLAGSVAQSGTVLNLTDAYVDPRFQRDWDVKTNYRTKSVLCVPMRDARGDVTGVIQALNALRGAFDSEDEELLLAFGGQAAQAIENAMLNEEIKSLFEGFVQASVMAIESRDPSTAGHSSRVASLTVMLAEATVLAKEGPYRNLTFSTEQLQEIRYASLLHDFGKIGVREAVLVKAEKLYPHELSLIRQRFELARKDRHIESLKRHLEAVRLHGLDALTSMEASEQARLEAEWKELDDALSFILQCNRPTVLAQGGFEQLTALRRFEFMDALQQKHNVLTASEVDVLSIPKGSLSVAERQEIESHVTHTFRFLSQIPWTKSLRQVPHIAFAHHEKLDGKGYPRLLDAPVIPVQAKMMAIADIYDALTASDRPYKKAVPHELALNILAQETEGGQLDPTLFRIFVEAQVPQRALKLR
jgi:HD-GYP domain-containing protein (c-di-GMP phosphodiesterase class II)